MKYLYLLFVVSFCSLAAQETSTISKVSKIQLGSNDPKTIYFQLEQMPSHITQLFYIRAGAGENSAGCLLQGDADYVNRSYSMLLAARTSGMPVHVHYCIDSNGYGLVRFTAF